MQILVIMNLKKEVTRESLAPYLKDEVEHTLEEYLDGNIRNFWIRADQIPGAVFMLESSSVEEAQKVMSRLPFVESGFTDLEFIPLEALKPLGMFIGKTM